MPQPGQRRRAISPFAARVALVVLLVSTVPGCGAPAATLPQAVNTDEIAGVVFADDGDGVLDGEPGVEGAVVIVRNRFGTRVGEIATDPGGHWSATELPEVGEPYTAAVSYEVDGASWSIVRLAERGQALSLPSIEPEPCDSCSVDEFPLPDLVPMASVPAAWVDEGFPGPDLYEFDDESEPGRVLMRIGTSTANTGDGPLLVIGGTPDGQGQPVEQRLLRTDGRYRDLGAGRFVFHEGHDHIHLDRFETMELVDPQSHETVAASKQSFCLTDVIPAAGARPPVADGQLVLDLLPWECGERAQGINVGWADYYGPALPDQYIDVTDVEPGDWVLRITVDPDDVLVESDETNNVVELEVTVPDASGR